MSEHLDVAKFEASHPNIDLISTIGSGEWRIELYLNRDNKRYYAKGPFARWDGICYVLLDKVLTDEDASKWVQQMNAQM